MHALQPVRDGEPAVVYAAACRRRDARTTPPLRWMDSIPPRPRGARHLYGAARGTTLVRSSRAIFLLISNTGTAVTVSGLQALGLPVR